MNTEMTLADVAWLRNLARHLVRDVDRADDLAQETWVAALHSGLGGVRDVRRWLAAILRNRLRMGRRSERREAARRSAIGEPATAEPSADVVARLQEQRLLLAAVDALGEPLRSTLLLRHVDGLPPREIGRRLGVPVATVRTRLKRALAKLRADLDHRHGSRAAWVTAFAPWFTAVPPAPPVFGGLLLMNSQTKLAIAAIALLGTIGLTWVAMAPPTGVELAAASAPAANMERAALARDPEVLPERERADAKAVGSTANTAAAPAAPERRVRGRVLRVDGTPVGGVAIVRRGDQTRVRSADDGTFTVVTNVAGGEYEAADEAWTTAFYADARHGSDAERILVVAPRTTFTGRVIDEDGVALSRAIVSLAVPPQVRTALPLVLDYSSPRYWHGVTDDAGRFVIADCARLDDAFAEFVHDACRPTVYPLANGMTDAVVVMARPKPGPDAISGCVLDPNGALVAGAQVLAGDASVITDVRGEFTLAKSELGNADRVAAFARGFLPGDAAIRGSGYLTLRLAGCAKAFTGVVVDRDGRGLRRCKVWVADPTYAGRVDQMIVAAEGLAGDAADRAETSRAWQSLASASEEERIARLPPDRLWSFVRTDDDGRFTLRGLGDRAYRVRAMDERTLLWSEFGPFAAGSTDLRLELPTDRVFAAVAGRVVDRTGRPVADARLQVVVPVVRVGTAGSWVQRTQVLGPAAAKADGTFVLRDVPQHCVLRVLGDAFETLDVGADLPHGIADVPGVPGALEVVVTLRCHFRIELQDASRADAFEMHDAGGRPMDVFRIEGDNRYSSQRVEIESGRTPALNVSEGARTLVLWKGGAEVARVPLALRPDADNVLRP